VRKKWNGTVEIEKKKFFKKDGHGCKKALRQLRVVGRIDFL
jgi:hypothetical protein